MKILYAASEAVPFCKTGGLADVAGSLPAALAAQGADVAVVLPLYQKVKEKFSDQLHFECYDYVDLAWRHSYCGLFSMERDGVTWYFLDNEQYFRRPELYGYMDDGERFGFFSRAVVRMLPITPAERTAKGRTAPADREPVPMRPPAPEETAASGFSGRAAPPTAPTESR